MLQNLESALFKTDFLLFVFVELLHSSFETYQTHTLYLCTPTDLKMGVKNRKSFQIKEKTFFTVCTLQMKANVTIKRCIVKFSYSVSKITFVFAKYQ